MITSGIESNHPRHNEQLLGPGYVTGNEDDGWFPNKTGLVGAFRISESPRINHFPTFEFSNSKFLI